VRARLALGALLLALPVVVGCNPEDVLETTAAYYGDLPDVEQSEKAAEMARVMPFYVVGACLALLLMGVAILNGLEHARTLGRAESIRFGAYVMLLCFVSLFLAMSVERAWLPAGHPVLAFLTTAVLAAVGTAIAARAKPERAVLSVGYLAVTMTLPLLGILLNGEVYLMDTTASLFIGFASGVLLTIVVSDPARGGLVDFLRRREADPTRRDR
jgi:hypothetical protein